MIKFDEKNVVQTKNGDAVSIGVGCKDSECCGGTFLLSMFGKDPRTYHQGKFTTEELQKLSKIINGLLDEA